MGNWVFNCPGITYMGEWALNYITYMGDWLFNNPGITYIID